MRNATPLRLLGIFHENQTDFEFAKSLRRILGQHERDVLDLEVEIVMISVVLGSTSTTCHSLL
jgi:hypothetical protein